MYELSRRVRFWVHPAQLDPRGGRPGAGQAQEGLGAFYELEVACRGQPGPTTGFVVNISEIEEAVRDNIDYLNTIRKVVRKAGRRKYPWDLLETVDVESCGKSRVLIGGLAEELHQRNLRALYRQIFEEDPLSSNDLDDSY